ncbi:7-carboxy-7-deazaguanine synthase QueE [Candidatus Alkanophaga liquidiphilum]|nr:Organic radical activating enzyme NrdG/QueE [Candidatus Alkanophaga liquidiphilum]RLG38552.1 MAG: 7-carboxy-7-deazaguanine synthase QueE [Candidatus Alkanophagales archaeon]
MEFLRLGPKGYVAEIFSSFQGEGPYVGRRQIFVRFAGCNLNCVYCDTPYAKEHTKLCSIEFHSGERREVKNPLSVTQVADSVRRLLTPDVHSVSFTGGEPLLQDAFVVAVAKSLRERGLSTYLETNGFSAERLSNVIKLFDFAAIDVKLREHLPSDEGYENLYENELKCVRIAIESGVETIVKVVVLGKGDLGDVKKLCEDISEFATAAPNFYFVIQPVTSPNGIKLSASDLYGFSEAAGEFFKDRVMAIPQVHKLLKAP